MRSRDFVFAPSQVLRFIVPILSAFFISMAAGPVKADTFTYSFTNVFNGPGTDTVTGTIILDPTDTFATSLTVDTNTGGFGLGQYIGSPLLNSFTVVSGQITSAHFASRGQDNNSPAVTCCSLYFPFTTWAGLASSPSGASAQFGSDLTFTPVGSTPVVPLPATLPLFATGLAGLGLLGWRRKKAA